MEQIDFSVSNPSPLRIDQAIMKIKTSLILVFVCCHIFCQFSIPQADALSTNIFITRGCKINEENGVHFCPERALQQRGLDPRAETMMAKTIPASEREHRYMFQARFYIRQANETTIMQFLNQDESLMDEYKPVLFLVASVKESNGMVRLCMFEKCLYKWDDLPRKFYISFVSSGREVYLKISGHGTKRFNLRHTLNGAYRPNGEHSVRWGIYHHDVVNGMAQSAGEVRVSKIQATFYES